MTKVRSLGLFLVALICFLLSVIAYLVVKNRSIESELVRNRAETGRVLQALTLAQSELSKTRSRITDQASSSKGRQAIDAALDVWLMKVDMLMVFLEKNPQWSIPQLKLLTISDWLDVTKDGNFETEADYRRALAKLRGLARQKVASSIGEALARSIAGNEGKIPISSEVLKHYIGQGFDPSYLDGLRINESGKLPGLKSKQKFVLVESPVDDVWDQTLFYNADGRWGVRSAGVSGEEMLESSIKRYYKDFGRNPTSIADLAAYPEMKGVDVESLKRVFAALTNRVNYPYK